MPVQRFDKVEIKATKTPEGFIEDSVVIGRVGILEYKKLDGSTRREYRPVEETFSIESLASIRGKPVTIGHPGLVTADNILKSKPIGTVLTEGKQDGDNIRADIVIYSLDTKGRELSCGYNVDLEEIPGVYNGQPYDAVQRNIRYNHLAVVKVGRAGSMARINMDSNQTYEDEGDILTMAKIKLQNGCEYEVPQEVAAEFDSVCTQNKDTKEKFSKAEIAAELAKTEGKKQKDQADAELDTLKAKVATHAAETAKVKQDAVDSINTAVTARIEMLKVAEKFKLDKADELSDKDIKLAVIKTVRGDGMDLTGKSDDYIQASFDMCKDGTGNRADAMAEQRRKANEKLKLDNKDQIQTSTEARQKMIDQTKNAYLGGK